MTQPQVERSAEQLAHEQAMAHVSAVLTKLDGAIERARKGQRELKKAGQTPKIEDAQPQAERYWRAPADPKAPSGRSAMSSCAVVLCSFHRILLWDMHQDPSRPAANLTLDELPDHDEALLFLAGDQFEASFVEHYQELTKVSQADAELVRRLTDLNKEISEDDRSYDPFVHLAQG